jgi:hypothetical protein
MQAKGRSVAQLVGKWLNSATGYRMMTTLNSLGTNEWTGIAGVDGNEQVHLYCWYEYRNIQ